MLLAICWCGRVSSLRVRHHLNSDLLILILPLYSINPNFLNLFMKKFTRVRGVRIIPVSVSRETIASMAPGCSCLPQRASNRSARARRSSLESKSQVLFDSKITTQHVRDELTHVHCLPSPGTFVVKPFERNSRIRLPPTLPARPTAARLKTRLTPRFAGG